MRGTPPRIFLTGASSGIGAALAHRYAAGGATLGLVARRGEMLESLAGGLDCPCHCYAVDVADASALRAAAEHFMAQAGVPDLVIANAGVSSGTLTELGQDLPAFRRIFETNVFGMLHTFSPFIAAMRSHGGGTLAGIASVAGIRGIPGAGAYSASKAATISYLESLRVELRGSGVRVVTVAPGYIATPMTAVNRYPMPFILPADEAARRIARDIARGVSFSVVPWQMAVVARLLRWLPDPLFDRAFARAGRKPRHLLD